MTRIGVIKQINAGTPFIYAISDTFNRAESIALNAWTKDQHSGNCYYVMTIPENALIGDCL